MSTRVNVTKTAPAMNTTLRRNLKYSSLVIVV